MSRIIWTTTTRSAHWSFPKLPLAVAVLVPAELSALQQAQLERTLTSVPFAQTLWLGQAQTPITDFSAARNSVLKLIEEPWVLWLDSDEWFDDPEITLQHLQKILGQTEHNQSLAFALKRVDQLHHQPLRFGETNAVVLTRLHHTTGGSFIRPVHETFQPRTGKPISTTLTLQHDAHQDLSSFFKKITHYSQLRAEDLLKQSRSPSQLKLWLDLLILPQAKFCWNFFWLQGWRDGWRGFSYAFMMSLHSAMVRISALELMRLKSKLPS
jgi:glycosyltransferase involved in cell wall biosynthesis